MATSTVIGRASFIRGRVSGDGDLEIAGRVEGEVAVNGDVVVDTSGLVAANVSAARIVVRGAVKGDLVAEQVLLIEAGARVVGDLRAPRVAIAPGGLVRGH
ncbi:MAG: polymer-forming cytoskeletal protein, partial [Labilithrix sp.]|nr:polymer-forming cytoskeletal protein [Labilithrix sp.]